MFGQGDWHDRVPRTLEENLEWRLDVLDTCKSNRRAQLQIIQACEEDILFYINTFGWQINPRKTGNEIGPFITWPFQEEYLRVVINKNLVDGEDILTEKSREMGATWLNLFLDDWCAQFHKWKKFLMMSHMKEAVDKTDDPDSLFWKIEFMHQMTPDWLVRGVKKKAMSFAYPATRSHITGAATTERAGVGGRATQVLLDEFSKHRDDFKILGQTADTGPRHFIGTHYGLDTAFYQLTQRPDLAKVVLHWTQHPEKRKGLYRFNQETGKVEILDKTYEFPFDYQFDMTGLPSGGPCPGLRSPWYDKECRRRNSARDVAMHLDIDPKGAGRQFFDPLIIEGLKRQARVPYWQGMLCYDADTAKPGEFVETQEGFIKLWLNLTPQRGIPPSQYTVGADISAGTGASPSCLSVMDGRTGAKVMEYKDAHMDPKTFAVFAVAICRAFADEDGNPASLIWEMQGPGATFGQRVIELGFRSVYFRHNEHSLEQQASSNPGWVPTNDNKRLVLEDYRAAIYSRQYDNPSIDALDECLSFVYVKGAVVHSKAEAEEDPSGATVNHGDMTVADMLSWKMGRHLKRKGIVKKEEVKVGSLAWRRQIRENKRRTEEVEWVN